MKLLREQTKQGWMLFPSIPDTNKWQVIKKPWKIVVLQELQRGKSFAGWGS